MFYQIAGLGLAPLLIAQGRRVRRVTPRLPEPPGARSGTEGQGPRLRLLIAGDSSAAGVGAATQDEAISGQCVSRLCSSFRVSWKLSAQSGHELREVVEALEAASAETFDAALIAAGVNDVTGRTSLKSWKAHHIRLIHLLTAKFAVRQVLLTSLPPMHRFPALPQPLRWYLGARARQLNAVLREIVDADKRCERLALEFPFEDSYMASDGFHPGPLAHALWGRHAAGAIQRRMQA